jgi:hypothetical protein
MKSVLLVALLLSSVSAFARPMPDICSGQSTCAKREGGRLGLSRVYYARGFGRDYQEAVDNATILFERTFGRMECGLFTGAHPDWHHYTTGNRQRPIGAWVKCDPSSGPARTQPRPRCTMIGGALFC